MATEILEIDDLERYLLLKNGNYLYKVPFRGGWAVLKLYYGTRSLTRYLLGTVSNYLSGQTSFMPRARLANEKQCLDLWRKFGFRVFATYDDVTVRGLPEGGYLLFEYLPAVKFVDYFGDESVSLEERLATYRRFLPVWHRRHDLAVKNREPRLVHENGDMKHVMIVGEEFLFFDFEMSFRSKRRIEEEVSGEILAYLKSLGKTVGETLFPIFLRETVAHYPERKYLEHTYKVMFHHPNPMIRAARHIDRHIHPRAAKRFSKYQVALQLRQAISGRCAFPPD